MSFLLERILWVSVSQKFNLWSNRTNKFATHNTKQYHQVALARMDALKSGMIHPESTIESHVRLISESDVARNRYIIKYMAKALLFCGKQCIAVRGHRDDSSADPESYRGNFLALLDYNIESGNSALARHLQESSKNAIYTSKTIQNDLIDCIGRHIRDNILKEIKEYKYLGERSEPHTVVFNQDFV